MLTVSIITAIAVLVTGVGSLIHSVRSDNRNQAIAVAHNERIATVEKHYKGVT